MKPNSMRLISSMFVTCRTTMSNGRSEKTNSNKPRRISFSLEMVVPRGNQKVLIVDDERVIADSLTAIFNAKGYEAAAAYNAETAIELLASWQPALAVVDVYMPGMNGIDLGKAIVAGLRSCKVVLFSGRAETDASLAPASIPFQILAKPVGPEALLALAEEHFEAEPLNLPLE